MGKLFETVDLNSYTHIPLTTTPIMLALGRSLRRVTPEEYTDQIDVAAEDLDEIMSDIEEDMFARGCHGIEAAANVGPAAMTVMHRRLARSIAQYSVAVCALRDRERPETLEVVSTALAPIMALRRRIAAGRSGHQLEVVDDHHVAAG